jgi:hypothetical protein
MQRPKFGNKARSASFLLTNFRPPNSRDLNRAECEGQEVEHMLIMVDRDAA